MKDEKPGIVAERIRFLLDGFGWDYAELGRRCGMDTGRLVAKYASGTEPGPGKLLAIAEAFQVTSDFLLGRRRLEEFAVVIRRETLEIYLSKNNVSHEHAYLLRRLAEDTSAPSDVNVWLTTHRMIERTFEIEQEQRRTGTLIPFKP